MKDPGMWRATTPPVVDRPPVTYRPEVRTTAGQALYLAVGRPLWGLRVELGLLLVLAASWAGVWWLTDSAWWPSGAVVGLVAMAVGVPAYRRELGAVLHRSAVRRQFERACRFAELATHNDRVPAIEHQTRVPAGDVLRVRIPAGSTAGAVVDAAETIAACLGVRDVRVIRNPADASRATVHIVRRDPLVEVERIPWPLAKARTALDLWRPIPVGVDETGAPVLISLVERFLLIGGEPGAGKSVALLLLLAVAALDPTVKLYLLDGKLVELIEWERSAARFVGPDVTEAITVLREVQAEMDRRYRDRTVRYHKRVTRDSGIGLLVVCIDELAFYLNGPDRKACAEFAAVLLDLLQRGRAAGVIVISATQKPSHDVVPTDLRDLYSSRWAMRCTTPQASDTILGAGWATRGVSAATIDAASRGVGWLWHEGTEPLRLRSYHLAPDEVRALAALAEQLRGVGPPDDDGEASPDPTAIDGTGGEAAGDGDRHDGDGVLREAA